jgi:hypothetical protein
MQERIQTELFVAKIEEILKEVTKSKTVISNRAQLIVDKPISVILIDFVVRFTSHLKIIGAVIDESSEETLPTIEHSLGILLRACLFDCITLSEIIVHLDEIDGTILWKNKERYI